MDLEIKRCQKLREINEKVLPMRVQKATRTHLYPKRQINCTEYTKK